MTARKIARIGSVSSGTMRPEDLLPEFLYTLGQLDKPRHDAFVAANADLLDSDEVDEDSDEYADGCDDLVNELFDILGEYAPPYCYFGANEGDGADYGFWPSLDSIRDGIDAGEVFQVEAGEEWDADSIGGASYVWEVNDHGNGTLYGKDGKELWSIV